MVLCCRVMEVMRTSSAVRLVILHLFIVLCEFDFFCVCPPHFMMSCHAKHVLDKQKSISSFNHYLFFLKPIVRCFPPQSSQCGSPYPPRGIPCPSLRLIWASSSPTPARSHLPNPSFSHHHLELRLNLFSTLRLALTPSHR